MPSPVGHTLFGLGIYIIWCKDIRLYLSQWVLIIWFIFCANLPDFDFFIGLALGNLSKFHQTYTHTLGFASIVGLITFFILRIVGCKRANFVSILTFIIIFFHVILDVFNYDSRPPVGVMLFWPFSDRYFNLIPIFYAVPHLQLNDIFNSFFIKAVIREIMLLFIPFLILIYFRLKRSYGKG